MFHKGSFIGGINIDLKLIMCKDNIVILSKLQSYVLHWYHAYIFHLVMDRTVAIIFQHLYWPDIKYVVREEVTNFDTCQHTKLSNRKYGKLPANLTEEILWNKLCVNII